MEPLVKICLKWGKSGKVPEDLIMSYADEGNKKSNEERKVKDNSKVPVLKK